MTKLFKKIAARFDTKLPVGMTEFNEWADSIIDLAGEFADRDSMKYALASNVIHMKHTADAAPKAYFVAVLRKAAANQVASAVFQDIKIKQEEAIKAAQLKQVEDTTPSSEATSSNEQKSV